VEVLDDGIVINPDARPASHWREKYAADADAGAGVDVEGT